MCGFEFYIIVKRIGKLLTQQNNNNNNDNNSEIIWLTSDTIKRREWWKNVYKWKRNWNWNMVCAQKKMCCEIGVQSIRYLKWGRPLAFNEDDIIENPKQKLSFLSCPSSWVCHGGNGNINNDATIIIIWFLSCVANYKSVNLLSSWTRKTTTDKDFYRWHIQRKKRTHRVFGLIWFSG